MDKGAIIAQLLKMLDEETASIVRSRDYHREAAVEAEGRMVSRYDSTKAEMSYLADAHQGRFRETDQLKAALRNMKLRTSAKAEVGALVELANQKERRYYFILPNGAGREVEFEGCKIVVISPQSPLFALLKALEVGDEVKVAGTEYNIAQIW